MLQPLDAFASIQCSKIRLRPGLRPGPLLSGFKRADSRRGGGGGEGKRRKKKGGDGSLGGVGGRRRRERKERGRKRGERRGGEGSWNRAADWLRPALFVFGLLNL